MFIVTLFVSGKKKKKNRKNWPTQERIKKWEGFQKGSDFFYKGTGVVTDWEQVTNIHPLWKMTCNGDHNSNSKPGGKQGHKRK